MAQCIECGEHYQDARKQLGYKTCLLCGEQNSKKVVRTVVPLSKSNYVLITDLELLKGINSKYTPV
jgi:predicted  nucleic acid-binding Zn-ribbon protein